MKYVLKNSIPYDEGFNNTSKNFLARKETVVHQNLNLKRNSAYHSLKLNFFMLLLKKIMVLQSDIKKLRSTLLKKYKKY